ncbi:MAG: hypothetical protein ACRDBY_12865 [Cetobacterium sp.]
MTILENNLKSMNLEQKQYLISLRDKLENRYTLVKEHKMWKALHCYINVYMITKENPVSFTTYLSVMGQESIDELYELTKDEKCYIDII